MSGTIVLAGAALLLTAMLCFTALRGWRGWLEVRRMEIAQRQIGLSDADDDGVALRIELAAVKERLKKLEAIASGVEL